MENRTKVVQTSLKLEEEKVNKQEAVPTVLPPASGNKQWKELYQAISHYAKGLGHEN